MGKNSITAKIIEFYVPPAFHKHMMSISAGQRGKVIPFAARRGAGSFTAYSEENWVQRVSGGDDRRGAGSFKAYLEEDWVQRVSGGDDNDRA